MTLTANPPNPCRPTAPRLSSRQDEEYDYIILGTGLKVCASFLVLFSLVARKVEGLFTLIVCALSLSATRVATQLVPAVAS